MEFFFYVFAKLFQNQFIWANYEYMSIWQGNLKIIFELTNQRLRQRGETTWSTSRFEMKAKPFPQSDLEGCHVQIIVIERLAINHVLRNKNKYYNILIRMTKPSSAVTNNLKVFIFIRVNTEWLDWNGHWIAKQFY